MALTTAPVPVRGRAPEAAAGRTRRPPARTRHYLMCRPTYFDVSYAINPWMRPGERVDRDRAVAQWERLRSTYELLGHRVDLVDPVPGLPDMVFAANGAVVIGDRVFGARFRHPQRAGEAPVYADWLRRHVPAGPAGGTAVRIPEAVSEGEGDFLLAGSRLLAGTGFRTEHAAHAEAAAFFGLPVVTLPLVDPRYYHLDTALGVLDEHTVAYHPPAFAPGARRALRRLFPDAILATDDDAAVLGLNLVSDGRHVVLPAGARDLTRALRRRGFEPVPVDLSELLKAGGGAKCATLEIHPGSAPTPGPSRRDAQPEPGR